MTWVTVIMSYSHFTVHRPTAYKWMSKYLTIVPWALLLVFPWKGPAATSQGNGYGWEREATQIVAGLLTWARANVDSRMLLWPTAQRRLTEIQRVSAEIWSGFLSQWVNRDLLVNNSIATFLVFTGIVGIDLSTTRWPPGPWSEGSGWAKGSLCVKVLP